MKNNIPAIELRIRPGASWRRIDWVALWTYRDLLFLLVRRDFLSKYSQTLLGPIWFVIQPLVTTLLFTVVFAGVAKISTNGSPPLLFYLSGMLPWNYFSNTFNATALTLTANAGLFGKVYFPRLIVPIGVAVSNLFAFAIHFILIAAVYLAFRMFGTSEVAGLRWELLLIPFVVIQVGALGLGAGLWMSAITTKYRDFVHVSGFVVSILFYATPVIFPLSIVPNKIIFLVMLNPLTFSEEAFRYILLGVGIFNPMLAISSFGTTIMLLISGIFAFQKCERTFIDTV